MRSTPRSDSAALQPRLPARVAVLIGRYRITGRRIRSLRQLLALGLLVAAALMALTPKEADGGEAVLVAARDIPVGAELSEADLAIRSVRSPPQGVLRADARSEAIGGQVAGPVRRGEILTDARLVGDRGPDPGPGRTAVPVPLADPAIAALLTAGMHVALVGLSEQRAEGTSTPTVTVLAADAIVLSVSEPVGGFGGGATRIAVASVPNVSADAVTAAAAAGSITVRFGP